MSIDGLLLVLLWIVVLIGLSRLVDRLLFRTLPPGVYRFIVMPGVVVHELSHAIGCLLTGARIVEIRLFSRHGGYVKHTRPRLPVLGPVIVSMAPLFGGVLFIYIIALLMDYSGIGYLDPARPVGALATLWSFLAANAARWHFWVFLYLLVSVAASLGPSNRDLRNALVGLVVLGLVLAAIITASDLLAGYLDVVARPLLSGLNIALFLLVLALLVISPFYLLRRRVP